MPANIYYLIIKLASVKANYINIITEKNYLNFKYSNYSYCSSFLKFQILTCN